MSAISLLAGLLLGIVIGAAIGYLFGHGRLAAADERARAAEHKATMIERDAAERVALLDGQLAERFQALSAAALDMSTARFLEVAEGRLQAANAHASSELETRRAAVEHLVGPLKETLARVEAQLRASDEARTESHAALAQQVELARQTSEQLRAQMQALATALRRPEARGRWGELQLRLVVELAGMSARCDIDEQVAVAVRDGTVFDLGRELYDRIAGLGRHVDRLGRALTRAVSTYNQAVGSLESRVLVSARRLSELGIVDADLASPTPVEETTRALGAPELVAHGPAATGPAGIGTTGIGTTGIGTTGIGTTGIGPTGIGPTGIGPTGIGPAIAPAEPEQPESERAEIAAAQAGRRVGLARAAR